MKAAAKAGHNKTRPHPWLGAGVLTIGVGAALASGTAVAGADTGQGAGPSDSPSATGSGPTRGADAGKARRSAANRASTSGTADSSPPTRLGARTSTPQGTDDSDVPEAEAAADTASTWSVSATPAEESEPTAKRLNTPARLPVATPSAQAPLAAAATPRPAVEATPVAEEGPAADPQEGDDWGEKSYLPDNEVIVPGSAVRLALQQISDTRELLRSETWDDGKILAGFASLAPHIFLAQASRTLTKWQDSIEEAKASVLDTAGSPMLHLFAQLSLLSTLTLPTTAGRALDLAAAFTPMVGLLGAPAAATEASKLIAQAERNGMVYAVRLMRTVDQTQQIVYLSVNGGPVVPIQLDTGSSGLSILGKYVGKKGLGEPTGEGTSGYGDDTNSVTYSYTKYLTTLDFGRGAVTAPGNIMMVDSGSENVFDNYGTAGIGTVGTLGIAANSGSGPTLNALLPGELRDGILLYQNIIGPWGLVVFGPNPLPSKGSVAGAPIGEVMIKINDGAQQLLKTNIDSGGVTGGLPASVVGSAKQGDKVAPGTTITVYTADGKAQLYSYVVTDSNSPVVYDDATASTSRPNTGNIPFGLGPIYLDYSPRDGLGATHFDYF